MFNLLFKPKNVKTLLCQARTLTTENPQPWNPKKRVSRPVMEKIRMLAASRPDLYNTVELSKEFRISVEAVGRILRSKYTPNAKDAERQERNRYKAMGERQSTFRKSDSPTERGTERQERNRNKTTGERQERSYYKAKGEPRSTLKRSMAPNEKSAYPQEQERYKTAGERSFKRFNNEQNRKK